MGRALLQVPPPFQSAALWGQPHAPYYLEVLCECVMEEKLSVRVWIVARLAQEDHSEEQRASKHLASRNGLDLTNNLLPPSSSKCLLHHTLFVSFFFVSVCCTFRFSSSSLHSTPLQLLFHTHIHPPLPPPLHPHLTSPTSHVPIRKNTSPAHVIYLTHGKAANPLFSIIFKYRTWMPETVK